MRVALITLGCAKNLVDAEVMLGLLDDAGHELVSDPQAADVVIVNTCAFISSAVDESRRVIESSLTLKRTCGVARVVVAGCLPQRYGRDLFRSLEGVDAVVGCSACDRIADVVEKVAEGHAVYDVGTPTFLYDHQTSRVLGTPDHLAYVKIAEGCNNHCSYCLIPALRGALRSRDPASVRREVEELLDLGVVEINLIAQDTTAYGMDIACESGTAGLLETVAGTGAPWIRLLYTHPAHLTDELLDVIAANENVLPYLDVPIQHVADRILSAMRRRTDGAGVRATMERIRERVPGATIRTTVMVGFPGETEREFEELVEFVESGAVDHLSVFEFSPETGTDAAEMAGRVSDAIANERGARLIEAARGLAAARALAAAGSRVEALVDAVGPESAVARTRGQAWETDGETLVEGTAGRVERGDIVTVVVTGGRDFDITARLADDPVGAGESA